MRKDDSAYLLDEEGEENKEDHDESDQFNTKTHAKRFK